MLCATFGEAGRRGEFAPLSQEEFARLRRHELEAACAALGIRPPRFLGCADKGLARDCWQSATEEIARRIARLRPAVVLTFGPDGVSGHTDHVALNGIVTAAFAAAGTSAALYYAARSASVPACCRPSQPIEPPPVTTEIAIAGFGERKLAAAKCHRSQRHLQPLDEERAEVLRTTPELFHRATPPWPGGDLEDHLLGLPWPGSGPA